GRRQSRAVGGTRLHLLLLGGGTAAGFRRLGGPDRHCCVGWCQRHRFWKLLRRRRRRRGDLDDRLGAVADRQRVVREHPERSGNGEDEHHRRRALRGPGGAARGSPVAPPRGRLLPVSPTHGPSYLILIRTASKAGVSLARSIIGMRWEPS